MAHVGGLGSAVGETSVPAWLTVVTAGVVVGGSFLFTSLLTDHEAIRIVNRWQILVPTVETLRRAVTTVLNTTGVGTLVAILVVGVLGPAAPTANLAILVVWAGWWAGFTMSVYTVGNAWPALNPWRTLARVFDRLTPETAVAPVRERVHPARIGSWPSIAGLIGLVWLEVVTPVSSNARLLSIVILGYSVVTLGGAVLVGPEIWFTRVDPISRVFRWYGRLAPVQRSAGGLTVRLPGGALAAREDVGTAEIDDAFVVALLWVTTYDGLVSTPAWATVMEPLVDAGIPAAGIYLLAIAGGFWLFLVAYRSAAAYARRTAETYVSTEFLRGWFAPSLLPIAAGYHAAHFLGYFIALSPPLLATLRAPLDPAFAAPLALPGWFGLLELGCVLGGHILAVWIAHSTAFDLFPGVLTPIRSQYPFIIAMIFYTMVSAWIVGQPAIEPPYT